MKKIREILRKCDMIMTLRAVATCVYVYVGRFKAFGIWWKISEYIIVSAQLALCYID